MVTDISWISTAMGGAIGFAAATFAAPLRERIYRQKLAVSFDPRDGCLIETNEHSRPNPEGGGTIKTGHDAKQIRLQIRNVKSGLLSGVRAYLSRVEVRRLEGDFATTGYADALQLAWSGRGANRFEAVDIPYGITAFVDVLSSRAVDREVISVDAAHWPERYARLLAEKGTYRLTVTLTAENARPVSKRLVIASNAHWQSLMNVVTD